MSSYQRNDRASLDFGNRLKAVELESAGNKRQVQELQKTALDEEQKRDANERRRMKRQENSRASAMLATGTASLAELQGIDQSLLPTAQRHLLQQEIIAKQFADVMPAPIRLTPEAQARIRNWQNSMPHVDPTQVWQQSNAAPEVAVDPVEQIHRDFYARRRQEQIQQQQSMLRPDHTALYEKVKQEKADADYRRTNGRNLGSLKDINQ